MGAGADHDVGLSLVVCSPCLETSLRDLTRGYGAEARSAGASCSKDACQEVVELNGPSCDTQTKRHAFMLTRNTTKGSSAQAWYCRSSDKSTLVGRVLRSKESFMTSLRSS